jgi:cellulose synthase/poly-beta-1,6-N-acetylglucosamine synthase-like glycosyltransferase
MNGRRAPRQRGASIGAIVLLVPQTMLVLVSGYQLLLAAIAARRHARGLDRTALPDRAHHRFVILVPAHNEELLIASTVASLRALDYPQELFRIHVVADNCTDSTAERARAAGAEVHVRFALDARGKGPALQWLLQRLWSLGDPHDAVVIVDADSTLSANFLRVMDAKLTEGHRVVQGYYAVRDPGTSWNVGLRYAGFALRHYLRPLARTAFGGSCGLYGNGMAFRSEILRDRPLTAHLTEDMELQLELLLAGVPVAFAPDAVVEAEMPTSLAGAQSQQQRWEQGRLDLARRYLPALVRTPRVRGRHQRVAQLDAAVDQVIPPFSVVAAATVITGLGGVALRSVWPSRAARFALPLAAAIAAAQALYLFVGLRLVHAPRAVYRSLVFAPVLIVWKVLLWLQVFLRPGSSTWVRTTRNGELDRPEVSRCVR